MENDATRLEQERWWKATTCIERVGVENGVCFWHHAVEGKGNEITAFSFLLRMLDLDGATVTTDALICQKTTTKQMKQEGGEYVLALKENHAPFITKWWSCLTEYAAKELILGKNGRRHVGRAWSYRYPSHMGDILCRLVCR